MEWIIRIGQLILSLSILVVLHELGHFIPAKLFKTKVEKFYLFFDPWFSLFKIKRGDTEYGIGWLPLGGYVKIAGMIDESVDTEQMNKPAEPWEFRSKPAWQRLIIMMGGIIVNVILGIALYTMVLFVWGKETIPNQNLTYGVACDSLALKMGIRDGDKVVSVAGNPVNNFYRVPIDIVMERATSIRVERAGELVDLPVTDENLSYLVKYQKMFLFPRYPAEIDSLLPNLPAINAGFKKGDVLFAIDSTPTPYHHLVQRQIQKSKNKNIVVKVLRGNDTVAINVKVDSTGALGFKSNIQKYIKTEKQTFTLLQAIPAGVHEGFEKIAMQVKQFAVLFKVKGAYQSIGGFYTIVQAFSPEWDWQTFWTFTAFFSVVLAFMNFLPIPALDGGHVMFLLYEIIARRKPGEKFMLYAQYVGMGLLLFLMLYANTDWLRKWLGN